MTHPVPTSPIQEEKIHVPEGGRDEAPEPPAAESWPARLWHAGHLIVAVVVTTAFLLWLLFGPGTHALTSSDHEPGGGAPKHPPVVRVVAPNLIHIQPGSTLEKKIPPAAVTKVPINTPILNVSGTVVASLRQGKNKGDYWQFHTQEMLSAWIDWQKAVADITFQENQLAKVKNLEEEREKAQEKVVSRLKKTVVAGTDSEKDLDDAILKLKEQRIQGNKNVYEAENQVKLARKVEAALARTLQLAGLDPELLRSLTNDADIVMAEVPESKVSLVKAGQKCTAKFFGVPGEVFNGEVTSIAPVLSKEKRTLRVLFKIEDKEDHVRAGMFGDIGLGTDTRATLLVPAVSVLHIGPSDYVLRAKGEDWEVTRVQVGETHDKSLEILDGLSEGDRVLGNGVILLKPFIMQSLQQAAPVVESGTQLKGKTAP